MIFGGEVLTATDIAAALGHANFGNPQNVSELPQDVIENAGKPC